ncbi:MAG: proton-conducting transporter transmembrane domain-containing protein, partial [Thermoleophilia bacterium]
RTGSVTALVLPAAAAAMFVAVGGFLCLRRNLLLLGIAFQIVGVAGIGVVGALVFLGAPAQGAAFGGTTGFGVGIDALSGFFLATLALVAVPVLVFSLSYLPGIRGASAVGLLTAGFVLSLAGVLVARTAPTFLTFWELMTLLPAGAILVTRREPRARRSVFEYLAITHLGGTGVWVAVLVLAAQGGLGHPEALRTVGAPMQTLVALAAVVGFGTKAGIVPFHSWLPRAHPLAPSHVSALMSGMMVKVALYGLIRVLFEWLGAVPVWLAVLLLALGTVSALGGVVYALFQHELKRLLAFHSIENVGIIVLGLGAALLFQSRGQNSWAALAYAAALLHTLNHAVFKSLLFLGAGAIDRVAHGLDLDRLGGLLKRMPRTGGAFLVGAMAIAGLPPLNGFVSEWLTLQSLLHVATDAGRPGADSALLDGFGVGPAVAGALATVGLGLTAALAVFCFVKVVGLVLLGPPRRLAVAEAVEAPLPMVVGMGILALMCVVLGLAPGFLLPHLAALAPDGRSVEAVAGAAPSFGGAMAGSVGTGGLPPLGLAALLVLVTGVLYVARGRRRAATAPVWACGQLLEEELQWTSAGFTKPLRLTLEAVLHAQREVVVVETGGVTQRLTYKGVVPHLFDTSLYGPVRRAALFAAAFVRRLQSGSLRAYVVYLLMLVIALLALDRLGAFR